MVKVGTFWFLTLENVRDKRSCILPQDLAGTTNSKKQICIKIVCKNGDLLNAELCEILEFGPLLDSFSKTAQLLFLLAHKLVF